MTRKEAETAVKALLGWSDQQYENCRYESGLSYLEQHLCHVPDRADLLERCGLFWKWWINQWVGRDCEFLQKEDQGGLTACKLEVYYIYLQTSGSAEKRPYTFIIEEAKKALKP